MKKCKKIILAGSSGYLGKALVAHYKPLAETLIVLTRGEASQIENVSILHWDGKTESDWVNAMDGADLLVNLCGKNVNCRYTQKESGGNHQFARVANQIIEYRSYEINESA